jgi:hypothetical protein
LRANHPIFLRVVQIALLLGLVAALILAPRVVLPFVALGVFVGLYIWGYYLVTFAFALRRFDRWLSDCLQCYRQSLSQGDATPHFSDNPEPSSRPPAPVIHPTQSRGESVRDDESADHATEDHNELIRTFDATNSSTPARQRATQIGRYTLGISAGNFPDLRKVAWHDTAEINRPKKRGLKLYKGSVNCFDRGWDVVVGVVGESVWALSVKFVFNTQAMMEAALVKLVDHFQEYHGDYFGDEKHPVQWLTPDSLVTINAGTFSSFYLVILTMSSAGE